MVSGAAGRVDTGAGAGLELGSLAALAGVVGDGAANVGGASDQAGQSTVGNLGEEGGDIIAGGGDGDKERDGNVLELHFGGLGVWLLGIQEKNRERERERVCRVEL